jgi:uncharacterized protein YgbK (DUF1537 family)
LPHLLVIADDLTGANDTGVQFARRGVTTLVSVDPAIDPPALAPDITVLVVDTETRHLSPSKAARRVSEAVRRAKQVGVEHFYKKTDSTLRGNVGAELEAMMSAAGGRRVAFVPAYPKAGRTTRAGYQYVDAVLLEQSAFGADPLEPADLSYVPDIVGRQTSVETMVVSPREANAAEALKGSFEGILVFDCASDEDLARIGGILTAARALDLTAGPAGFAELLPGLLDLPSEKRTIARREGPLLLVCGSVNEVSLRQARFARETGYADIALGPEMTCATGQPLSDEGQTLAARAVRQLADGKDVLVRTVLDRSELSSYLAQGSLEEGDPATFRLVADNIARFARHVLSDGQAGGCAVFGGDTALAFVKAAGCTSLIPQDEIAPGVVISELPEADMPFDFITKSGGFGPEDLPRVITDYLRRPQNG